MSTPTTLRPTDTPTAVPPVPPVLFSDEPRSTHSPPPPTGPRLQPPPPSPEHRGPDQSRPAPKETPSLSRLLRAGLRLGFAAAGIAISFAIDGGIFGVVLALFALTVPFEKLYPRQKGQKLRRPLLGTDIAFALMGPVLNVVGVVAAVVIGAFSLFWIPGLLLRPVVGALPAFVVPIVAFFLFDFLAYWAHRWAHEVPFLWRFHAVHHSPEHMDWISGFRIHPFDGVLIAPGVVFLLAAGVDGEVAGLLALFQIVLGIFFHANVRVRWRWLDKLVANPEFHHWHHANEADAIGHNYGAALPQWDLLFGTFFMPGRESTRRPSHYGVDEYLPRNLLGMLTHPLRGARRHVSLVWHPIRAVKAGVRGARRLLVDVRASTFRPTHSVRRSTAIGCSSTNASMFESNSERPGWQPDEAEWQR